MKETKKVCLQCGKEFLTKDPRKRFCCQKCGVNWHNAHRKTDKEPKTCIICGAEFIPWNKTQVTCGRKECVRINSNTNKKKKRGVYKYAKNGGLTMPPSTPRKKKKPWAECTPTERWEQMTLTELSGEIARMFPGKSFGDVRLLKEQGKLPEDFGKDVRE